MSPSATGAARATHAARARRATAPARREVRAPLRVVTPADRRRAQTGRGRQLAGILAVVILVASLVAVVVAHTMVAADQVRLSQVRAALATEQATNRQLQVSVAQNSDPGRVVAAAQKQGMSVTPVVQLPYTSLTTPLGPPHITPAPPPPPAATSTGSSTTGASGTSGTGATSTTNTGAQSSGTTGPASTR